MVAKTINYILVLKMLRMELIEFRCYSSHKKLLTSVVSETKQVKRENGHRGI